ncbi:MAG TPA: hypothetical protein VHA30_01270 [Patescibacteria group bacterium]|nr:hypothetical protein [Patescibacteria group bacterium]
MEISEEKFNQRKTEAENFYKSIGPTKCPYFKGECIYFNSQGFEHLIFKEWNKTRSQREQYVRFRLLPLAVGVIKKSGTLQEYDERKLFVRRKSKDGWGRTMKKVKYYVFVAIIGELRLKVIIKEIEGSQKNFHSVYPSWQAVIDGSGIKKKKFYSGEPETD